MKIIKFLSLIIIFLSSALTLKAEETYTIATGQFQKIKITSNVSVVYKNLPDSAGFARYMAPAGNQDLFILSVKNNGTLRIQSAQTGNKDEEYPILYVYSDFLDAVESSSNKTVVIENLNPCASFNVNQIGNGSIIVENIKCTDLTASITTGNGSIILSGSCENASFRMLGAGLISADRLSAENVKCSILGTGSIGCWPIDNLNVKGIGSTKIYYKGNPKIKKSGGGKLFELPEEYGVTKSEEHVKVALETEPQKIEIVTSDDEEEEEDEDFQTVVTLDD